MVRALVTVVVVVVVVCVDDVVCESAMNLRMRAGVYIHLYTPCPRLTRRGYMYTTLRNRAEWSEQASE